MRAWTPKYTKWARRIYALANSIYPGKPPLGCFADVKLFFSSFKWVVAAATSRGGLSVFLFSIFLFCSFAASLSTVLILTPCYPVSSRARQAWNSVLLHDVSMNETVVRCIRELQSECSLVSYERTVRNVCCMAHISSGKHFICSAELSRFLLSLFPDLVPYFYQKK